LSNESIEKDVVPNRNNNSEKEQQQKSKGKGYDFIKVEINNYIGNQDNEKNNLHRFY
jgi:hypothetical protein